MADFNLGADILGFQLALVCFEVVGLKID